MKTGNFSPLPTLITQQLNSWYLEFRGNLSKQIRPESKPSLFVSPAFPQMIVFTKRKRKLKL